MHLKW